MAVSPRDLLLLRRTLDGDACCPHKGGCPPQLLQVAIQLVPQKGPRDKTVYVAGDVVGCLSVPGIRLCMLLGMLLVVCLTSQI